MPAGQQEQQPPLRPPPAAGAGLRRRHGRGRLPLPRRPLLARPPRRLLRHQPPPRLPIIPHPLLPPLHLPLSLPRRLYPPPHPHPAAAVRGESDFEPGGGRPPRDTGPAVAAPESGGGHEGAADGGGAEGAAGAVRVEESPAVDRRHPYPRPHLPDPSRHRPRATLMLLPCDLTWVVVDAGRLTNETGAIINKSGVNVVHLPFDGSMPVSWLVRQKVEAQMRIHALRVVRDRKLDGIVMSADESNMHGLELFDEIQNVKWMGAVSVGVLAHDSSDPDWGRVSSAKAEEDFPIPVMGPACNSSGHLTGWHTFNSLPYAVKNAAVSGEGYIVLPGKLEWAGFVFTSRLLWTEVESKPDWIGNLDSILEEGSEIESPLSLLKDAAFVEPLSKCGRKVMLWWFQAKASADSKFPPGH